MYSYPMLRISKQREEFHMYILMKKDYKPCLLYNELDK